MTSKGAQGMSLKLPKPPGKTPRREDAAGGALLAQRVFRLRNVVSFLLALVVLYLMYRQLVGLDWGEVWASIRGTNLWLFAFAFAVFYGTFFLRALRWKVLLGSVAIATLPSIPCPRPSA
ncbi:MAG: hypothetical protein QOI57_2858 [Rubrobacteraceae bacterium]|nr:hypothetical protein [Rubrobacteraceae bacterium]